MYCIDCGKVARCPHCDIGLTYHKGRERLVCHYCGYSVPFPSPCPSCKGLHFHPMGQGTERVEEYIGTLLPPGGRVLRLDRDSTRRPGRMEEILESFARQEAQVLVGTQMLSKGHHFPHVTLAVVADGDIGLNLPDYRAAERTFSFWCSHRAGPGAARSGQVIIQTRDVNHYCWQYVKNGDYEGFYDYEIAHAQAAALSPFINLACCGFPTLWTGGRADAARADLRSAAFGEQRRDRSWPRARAAAAPAGTQAVSVPPQGWRLAIYPCPLCRASASRLAPEPAYFTGYRPREHAVARKTFFSEKENRQRNNGCQGALGGSSCLLGSALQRRTPIVRLRPLQAWRRPVAPAFCQILTMYASSVRTGCRWQPALRPVRTKPSRWYALTAEGAALTVSGVWGARLGRRLRNVSKSRRPIPCL